MSQSYPFLAVDYIFALLHRVTWLFPQPELPQRMHGSFAGIDYLASYNRSYLVFLYFYSDESLLKSRYTNRVKLQLQLQYYNNACLTLP